MYLFVHDLAIQDLEGIQVNALKERENGVADGGVVSQTQIFLRGARGRGRMAVPVGENLQALAAGISQCRKLILWSKREMLRRVVDVLHPVVLCHDITFRAAGAQQIAARFIGCAMISCGIFIFSMFNVMSLRSMTFVTTRQNSNKFDFTLAVPKVQCFKSQAACS